jgi:hypothetical protein
MDAMSSLSLMALAQRTIRNWAAQEYVVLSIRWSQVEYF